jgi:predicted nucleic acid-binding protein
VNKILLDTDVILDFLFDRKPWSEDAAIILTLCETGKISAFVTPVMLSNLYYILRKTASHKKVIEKLSALLSITDVLTMNREIVNQALYSGFQDFEDALQNYSAQQADGVGIVITRNVNDYKTSSLSVKTPESFLRMLSASE